MESSIKIKMHCSMRFTHSLFIMSFFYVTPFFCYNQLSPLALGRADPHCWESSSALLLEMRKPYVSDSVSGFWDVLVFLKTSENLKHGALFWDLAQLFWDIYVDCVLSRTHGLGKRQLAEAQHQIRAFPSRITRRIFSQMTPVQKKKELNQELISTYTHKFQSALLRRITRHLRMKKRQI